MKRTEITVFPDGRCNLSPVRTREHDHYLAWEERDGTIILVPASLVLVSVASILEDGEAVTKPEPLPWEEPG